MEYQKWKNIKEAIEGGGFENLAELESEEKEFLFAEYEKEQCSFFVFFQPKNFKVSYRITSFPQQVVSSALNLKQLAEENELEFVIMKDHICKENEKGEVEHIYYGIDAQKHLVNRMTEEVLESAGVYQEQQEYLENLDEGEMFHC